MDRMDEWINGVIEEGEERRAWIVFVYLYFNITLLYKTPKLLIFLCIIRPFELVSLKFPFIEFMS